MSVSDDKRLELMLLPVQGLHRFVSLLLGLSTGALVVWINLLSGTHFARRVSLFLVLSIAAFGIAALFCLRLLTRHIELQAIMADAIQDAGDDWRRAAVPQVERIIEQMERSANRLDVIFRLGVMFAAIFIILLWLVR